MISAPRYPAELPPTPIGAVNGVLCSCWLKSSPSMLLPLPFDCELSPTSLFSLRIEVM